MRATANLSAPKKIEAIEKLKKNQSILMSYISDYSIEQDFEISKHPIKSKDIITAKQPIVEDYSPIQLNNSNVLSNLNLRQKNELGCFVDSALEMSNDTGWVFDVLGASNLGFTDNGKRLVLVDTIPSRVNRINDPSVRYLEALASEINPVIFSTLKLNVHLEK